MRIPKPQEIYKHFKGKFYQIITLATDTESGEKLVVYQALYGDFSIYSRPLWMFTETLDPIKYPDAVQAHRFELVKPTGDRTDIKAANLKIPGVLKKTPINNEDKAIKDKADEIEEQLLLNSARDRGVMGKTIEEEAKELNMDPRVVAFLDADSSNERLKILSELGHSITDDQIDICAMAIDVKVDAGDTFDRYIALRDSISAKMRFEIERAER